VTRPTAVTRYELCGGARPGRGAAPQGRRCPEASGSSGRGVNVRTAPSPLPQRALLTTGPVGGPGRSPRPLTLISIHELIHELLATYASTAHCGARSARQHPQCRACMCWYSDYRSEARFSSSLRGQTAKIPSHSTQENAGHIRVRLAGVTSCRGR